MCWCLRFMFPRVCIWAVQNSSICSSCSLPGVYFLLSGHCSMNHRRKVSSQKHWLLSDDEQVELAGSGTPAGAWRAGRPWWLWELGHLADCVHHLLLGIKREDSSGTARLAPKWRLLKRPWHPTRFSCPGLQREMRPLLPLRFPQRLVVWSLMWINVWTDILWGRASSTHWQMAGTPVFLSLNSKSNSPFHLYRISVSDFAPFLETMLKDKTNPWKHKIW